MTEQQPTVTVQDLDKLVDDYAKARADADEKADIAAEASKLVNALSMKMSGYLRELKRDDYKSKIGTFYFIRKWSVATPKDPSDKDAFFEWCRERGIEDKYKTVNSQALNALYKEEVEACEAKGEFISIPGIGAPTLMETVGFRKAK